MGCEYTLAPWGALLLETVPAVETAEPEWAEEAGDIEGVQSL